MFGRGSHNEKAQHATTRRIAGFGYRNEQKFHLFTWLRLHGVDLITMAMAGGAALGVHYAPPAYRRYFAIAFQDGEIIFPQTALPMQKDLVPIWASAFTSVFVPFFFFCLLQIRIKSINHLLTTFVGLLKSLVTGALFQVVIKGVIGGPRPHFLVVCNPQIPEGMVGSGFKQLYFTREVCTGDEKKINDALESLPSGHATAAFAGFVYLSLYFNAQFKILSSHNPAYWKMLLFMAPILAALLISLIMVMNGFHHWWDITLGGLIGTSCAFIAFRQTFASIWDFRFNHALLPKTTSLFLKKPLEGAGTLAFAYTPGHGQVPVTREGGWGYIGDTVNGAPFDAVNMGDETKNRNRSRDANITTGNDATQNV